MHGSENRADLVVFVCNAATGAHVEGHGGSQGAFCGRFTFGLEIALQRATDNTQGHVVNGNPCCVFDVFETFQGEFGRVKYPVRAY